MGLFTGCGVKGLHLEGKRRIRGVEAGDEWRAIEARLQHQLHVQKTIQVVKRQYYTGDINSIANPNENQKLTSKKAQKVQTMDSHSRLEGHRKTIPGLTTPLMAYSNWQKAVPGYKQNNLFLTDNPRAQSRFQQNPRQCKTTSRFALGPASP
ncbi:hypothetical protein BJX66DRAFT_335298 [Aspergillus keveii]|uniref:Uncharacterized protein n=1 Tax=Aspergillus keveii TaxID=714993 RepID=A0ABR4GDK2_9EURO